MHRWADTCTSQSILIGLHILLRHSDSPADSPTLEHGRWGKSPKRRFLTNVCKAVQLIHCSLPLRRDEIHKGLLFFRRMATTGSEPSERFLKSGVRISEFHACNRKFQKSQRDLVGEDGVCCPQCARSTKCFSSICRAALRSPRGPSALGRRGTRAGH